MRKINQNIFVENDLRELENFYNMKGRFTEASFRKGKAFWVAQKASAVISRKIGLPIGISPIPEEFEDSYGKFTSYFGFMGNRAIRFNFLTGKNTILQSVDIYDKFDDLVPSYNIDLNGFNIVQTIDQIVEVITGEYFSYKESYKDPETLMEAIKISDMLVAWFNSHPDEAQEIRDGVFNYNREYINVNNYFQVEFGKVRKYSSARLKGDLKRLAKDGKIDLNVNTVPAVTVQKGVPVKKIVLDPSLQKVYEDALNPTPKQIMQDMEDTVRLIAKGSKAYPGAIIHGKPGTGKTETVERIMKEEGVRPIKIDQKLSAYTAFINVLYQNAQDEVIIFDDNDYVFKDPAIVNLLLKVLDMKPVRRIHIQSPIKVVGTDITIDEDFDFESKVIFISNRSKMDEALLSRVSGAVFELNFTKEEMMELIKDALYNMYTEVVEITDQMRDEVFDFAVKALPAFNDIDYRAFNYILTFRLAAEEGGQPDSVWQGRAFKMLINYRKSFKTRG